MQGAPADKLRDLTPDNKHRIYRELRESQPVYWSSTYLGWVLTRYADVSLVLRHPNTRGLSVMAGLASLQTRGGPALPNLAAFLASLSLLAGPPRHGQIRRLLSSPLAGVRDLKLAQIIGDKAESLLDAAQRKCAIDLADGYAREISLCALGAVLGIGAQDVARLSVNAREFWPVFEHALPSLRTLRRFDELAAILLRFFAGLIERRRTAGGADGLSCLIRMAAAEFDCGDEELAGCCTFFFMAGEETTTAAIAYGAWSMLRCAELRHALAEAPDRMPAAAREFIRLASPIQYVAREMSAALELDGHHIAPGEPIYLMLAAANRDPAAFPDPDRVDLTRDGPEPLDFAVGPHRCIGMALALIEVEAAIRHLLPRSTLRLSDQPQVWTNRRNIAPLHHLCAVFG